MTRRSIKISADVPAGVSDDEIARFVTHALECWGGQFDPEDPLFRSLGVHWVSLAGVRYENDGKEIK